MDAGPVSSPTFRPSAAGGPDQAPARRRRRGPGLGDKRCEVGRGRLAASTTGVSPRPVRDRSGERIGTRARARPNPAPGSGTQDAAGADAHGIYSLIVPFLLISGQG